MISGIYIGLSDDDLKANTCIQKHCSLCTEEVGPNAESNKTYLNNCM